MVLKKQVLITTGDIDGIGQEITLKSLKELIPCKDFRFLIYTSSQNTWPKSIGNFKFVPIKNHLSFDHQTLKPQEIGVFSFSKSPHFWVESAAKRALKYSNSGVALVNAPMSKNSKGWGHTEILKMVSGSNELHMGFLGKKFNVCLGTTHIPVDQVYAKLNSKSVKSSYQAAITLNLLAGGKSEVKVLGLNPHSGENGAISKQDLEILKWLPKAAKKTLLVPDAAFIAPSINDTYLSWYHDQGLIPFKMVHGFSHGIQVTLGLPFIRTSVDHGTAKDLFGKGLANHKSLLLALNTGLKLVRKFNNSLLLPQESP